MIIHTTHDSCGCLCLGLLLDAHLVKVGRVGNVLFPLNLLCKSQILVEDTHDQMELLEIAPQFQFIGTTTCTLSIVEGIAFEYALIMMIQYASEKHV